MSSDPTRHPGLTRRDFVKSAAAASAFAALPAVSWGRILGANQRLNFAVIGTGGIGTVHLRSLLNRTEQDNIAVTRVCDVYRRRLNNAVGLLGGDENRGTMEYREILDDPDVHAIIIATPDHWHTKIAVEAMEAGKDVYCEKPLSLTIEQAIECRDVVKRTGRALQVGPQGTSSGLWWTARDAIARGRIGKVVWSQGAYCRNSREGQFNWRIDPDAGPSNPRSADGYVWWDRWLGHEYGLAERIPWNADHFFRFRKYWAYNGGVATDLMYHKLAPLLLAISGPDGEYPSRVVAAGGRYIEKDERDIPDVKMLMIDYPSEHTIVLISVMVNDVGVDDMIRGQHGTMEFGNTVRIREQGTWWPEFREVNADFVSTTMTKDDRGRDVPDPRPGAARFEISPEGPHAGPGSIERHVGNLLNAIREGESLRCNIDLGCSTMVAIKMGVEAYRRNKVMLWDSQREVAVES